MTQIWKENYKITSYLVNLRGKAGLHAILNLIQDVGLLHATNMQIRLPKNRGWVFTRQKLTMTSWPAWNETVTIRTWLRPPTSEVFLVRDYEIYVGEKKLGEAASTFSVMDMEKRKMATYDWKEFSALWRQDFQLDLTPKKIQINQNVEELAQFQVRNSDIDLNQHVNNTKYAQWILDALPIEILKAGVDLYSYEVNFLAETTMGDVISVCTSVTDAQDEFHMTQFQGFRKSDRKLVFSAEMKVKPTEQK